MPAAKPVKKAEKPTWNVPAAIRAEKPSLPSFVPPGPDNPLGDFWMAFTDRQHGIHGTNEPYGVGRRVSHGCIRLYPGDIIDLAKRVENGTPVRIIYQPIKLGQDNKRLFLEVHRDFLGRITDPRKVILETAKALGWQQIPDGPPLAELIEQARGVPVALTQP